MSKKTVIFSSFEKIHLEEISTGQLANWMRDRFSFSIVDAYNAAKMVKEAHRLGRIRGEVLVAAGDNARS